MTRKLNVSQSRTVYERCKKQLVMKECYNNIFKVTINYMSIFRSGKWKVAYGYMSVFENVMCRHCFIIDETGQVIDPTIFTPTSVNLDRKYLIMKIFDDIDEYFTALEQENHYPALEKYLKEHAIKMQKQANDTGFVLIG